jgi:hypothetical protein
MDSNNININNFFPVYKTGISYQPVGTNSNQTVYLSMEADPELLTNGLYKPINSAKDFLKYNGNVVESVEYKTLVNYFKGISYDVSGGANVSPPKSCIIVSFNHPVIAKKKKAIVEGAENSANDVGDTIGDVMQRLVNLGITNFYGFQTLFDQYDITNDAIYADITSAIDFTETQNINYCFLHTNKLSNLEALRQKLVDNEYLYHDTEQDIYIPTKGSFQISVLADGDNMGITRTQADNYANSVIGGSIIGASGNRYAQTNAYCRNPFLVKYAGNIDGALFTEEDESLILSMGAIGYTTLAGNAETFVGGLGSGRNTKDLVWFDLAQNAVYMGYRIQLKMVKLAQKGNLYEGTATTEMNACVQELLQAGLIKQPERPFDWENDLIDNEYMSYAALREFGSETSTFKSQVQNAVNSKGMSFNIIPYQLASDQGFPFKDFISFVYAPKTSTSAFKSLKRKLQKESKIVIVLKSLPEDIKIKLTSLPNKLLANGEHKPIIVSFNNNNNDHAVLDDYILTYTPTTIRERGLINIADFTPQQWFNGVATYLNQLNIG